MPGIDIVALIKTLGYLGVWAILFAESGILFFFFLPGDSLLFTAGFLASQGFLNIVILSAGGFIAAMTGNLLGYEVGRRVGLRLFDRPDSRFLKRKHLEMTQRFFEKHGAMAVIMARFMPIIRTFTPFLAGAVFMPYRRFFLHTVIGAVLWAVGLCVAGYYFGRLMPPDQVDRYLLPIIVGIIIASLLPSLWHIYREYRLHKKS